MKKYLSPVLLGLALVLPVACATLPVPTPESVALDSSRWPDTTLEDLQKGRRLYAANCAACHHLHLPSEFTGARWEEILGRMQPKARLSDPDTNDVLEYLTAFSKGAVPRKAEVP